MEGAGNCKRAYEKPRVRTIELKADEVLAAGCKTANGGIAVGPPTCTQVQFCAAPGS